MNVRAPSQGPEIPPVEIALGVIETHRRWYNEALNASIGESRFDNQIFVKEFWSRFRTYIAQLIPHERVPWSMLKSDRITHMIEVLNWKMPEQAFLERSG